jgi:hypothetical protein
MKNVRTTEAPNKGASDFLFGNKLVHSMRAD